jgi:hypothetical protein
MFRRCGLIIVGFVNIERAECHARTYRELRLVVGYLKRVLRFSGVNLARSGTARREI